MAATNTNDAGASMPGTTDTADPTGTTDPSDTTVTDFAEVQELPALLTVAEVAKIRRVHLQTVYLSIQRGLLRAINVGTARRPAYRIPRDAVLAPNDAACQKNEVRSTCQRCAPSKGNTR